MEIPRKCSEGANRICCPICRNCNKDLFCTDVDSDRNGNIRLLALLFFTVFLAISGSLLLEPAARGYETSKLLNGIAAGGGRHH
jgi:hypothetical protein